MIQIYIQFNFDTKQEWIDFYSKFTQHDEFVKHSPVCKNIAEHDSDFDFEKMLDFFIEHEYLFILESRAFIMTKSPKLLKSLNEFISENHYEKNYSIRDKHNDKIAASIDELLTRFG